MTRKRYVQDPVTRRLIPREEYRRPRALVEVLSDIEPFRSPIDGTLITSRPHLREHNRRHNVAQHGEYGENNGQEWFKAQDQARNKRMRGETPEAKSERLRTIIPIVTRNER